jgi:hypothetical protein
VELVLALAATIPFVSGGGVKAFTVALNPNH